MTLDQILERARVSMHSPEWGDVATALVDIFPDLPCGMEEARVTLVDGEPRVTITEEAWRYYEPEEARAYAASLLRCADEIELARKQKP